MTKSAELSENSVAKIPGAPITRSETAVVVNGEIESVVEKSV